MAAPDRKELTAQLEPAVGRAVRSAGLELEVLEVRPAGRRRLVTVVVDSEAGVGLDEVAEVSRVVSAELDAHEDVLGGPYTLEVTSPGVQRPLTRPGHWRRARQRQVRVRLAEGGELVGRVGPAGEDAVLLLVEGVPRTVRYADLERAVVQVEFQRPPVEELRALAAAETAWAEAAAPPGEREETPGEREEPR